MAALPSTEEIVKYYGELDEQYQDSERALAETVWHFMTRKDK